MAKKAIVSLFSGALGLDVGLEKAGFKIKVAVECNRFAAETIKLNRPDIRVLQRDIRQLSTNEILSAAGLKVGEPTILTGGPSCQTFSTAGSRKSLTDPRGGLFREFVRVVREAQPRFFVMENVRGILSAAVKHRPLAKRGPGYPALEPGELLGSALQVILEELRGLGYRTVFGILNAADFGVPQRRERVVFIGSRDGEDVRLPRPTHGREEWVTLQEAVKGLVDPDPETTTIPSGKAVFLKHVPPGGNWRDLPVPLQKKALGRAYISWGGRSGFCRRLAWEKPTPALTTRPDSKATMLCHPTELRPLSVREYARVQQFPDDWKFAGGTPQKYIMIGNAVPIGLGHAVGQALAERLRRVTNKKLQPGVVCASAELEERIKNRRRIILNPARMRRYKSLEAAQRWIKRSLSSTTPPKPRRSPRKRSVQ
jgi:DNA (cytosine-5)-methyltransferase 1